MKNKIKQNSQPIPRYPKFDSKQIIDVNIKYENTKLLEENTGVNLCNLGEANSFQIL